MKKKKDMNLIDAEVTKVIGEPYPRFLKWWIKVESIDMGGLSEDNLMFDTKEEAEAVQPGYKFQH